MGVLGKIIVRFMPVAPKFLVKRIASRYVAGYDLESAINLMKKMSVEDTSFTIDVLGEEINGIEEARYFVEEYLRVLDSIVSNQIDANISLKPTALGLLIDKDEAISNIEQIIKKAALNDIFVRLDMEDHRVTQDTIDVVLIMQEKGYQNIGTVLQGRLFRTKKDIIDISENILNNNGFKVDKSEWFLELHKYNITKNMYKDEKKENIFLTNHREIGDFMVLDESIPGKKYRRYSDFEWHDDNCNNPFKCNTIIYFLNKMPEKNVGGNFYWRPKNMKGKDMEKEKIKIKNNMILLMRGDISHSPGWFISDNKQSIYRYSVVVQIKASE